MNTTTTPALPFYTTESDNLFIVKSEKKMQNAEQQHMSYNGRPSKGNVMAMHPEFTSLYPYPNESLQYWKVYFDFGYYFLLNPFRFSWNEEIQDYEIKSNRIQKVILIVFSILTGWYFLMKCYMLYLEPEDGNPAKYFELCYYFCDTFFLTFMFYVNAKLRKEEIILVFQTLQASNHVYSHNTTAYIKTHRKATVICILCACSVCLHFFEILQDQNWSMYAYFDYYIEDAEKIFFFKPENSTDGHSKPVIVPFAIISMVSNLNEKVLNAYSDILFTMTVLMFSTNARELKHYMRHGNGSPTDILNHYRWLKQTTDKINDSMSIIIAMFVMANIPFYATNVFDVFKNPNMFIRLRYLFYCSYYFPSLVLAAKSNKDVDKIKAWICQENTYQGMDSAKLSVVLHEVNFETVALSAFECFSVTYSLVGSVVSVILTYALLKTQMQK